MKSDQLPSYSTYFEILLVFVCLPTLSRPVRQTIYSWVTVVPCSAGRGGPDLDPDPFRKGVSTVD